jgi:Protein of unknown function (DUF3108)
MKTLALAILVACTSGAFAADRRFAAGETLDYTLSWLAISAGSARMTVGPASDAGKISMRSIAESASGFSRIYHVRDELESIVTRDNFSTVYFRKRLKEGKRNKDETTVINPARGIATRKGKDTPVPTPVFDPLSIIFYLRTLDLTVGRVYRMPVYADGKLYTLEARVTGRESIDTDFGTLDAFVVVPKSRVGGIFRDEDNRLTIWYSADDRHLPLRIQSEVKFGTITATLRKVRAGIVNDSK